MDEALGERRAWGGAAPVPGFSSTTPASTVAASTAPATTAAVCAATLFGIRSAFRPGRFHCMSPVHSRDSVRNVALSGTFPGSTTPRGQTLSLGGPEGHRTLWYRANVHEGGPDDSRQRVVNDYFDADGDAWSAFYDGDDPWSRVYRKRRGVAMAMVDRCSSPSAGPVLDVGCGPGLHAVQLARRGFQVTAMDASAEMVRQARRRVGEQSLDDQVQVLRSDTHYLAFAPDSFALVVALGVVPWLHSPARAIGEWARVLRAGGHLVVSADNRFRITEALDPRVSPLLAKARAAGRARRGVPRAHAAFHGHAEFGRLLGSHGFEVLDAPTFGFSPFTVFGRAPFSDAVGQRVDARLQRWADAGVPGIRRSGAQILALARRHGGGA